MWTLQASGFSGFASGHERTVIMAMTAGLGSKLCHGGRCIGGLGLNTAQATAVTDVLWEVGRQGGGHMPSLLRPPLIPTPAPRRTGEGGEGYMLCGQ